MRYTVITLIVLGFSSCAIQPDYASRNQVPETLTVHPDGAYEYRERFVSQEDVIIYDDGRGGERAAVKVRVPKYPDFYRDTIRVVRINDDETTAGD